MSTIAPMTAEQAETLNSVWTDVQNIIAAECHKRNLSAVLDDILSDAITRTCTAIAKLDLNDAERIKSRARSCALDAIKTAARHARNVAQHRAAVSAANSIAARRNGEPVI